MNVSRVFKQHKLKLICISFLVIFLGIICADFLVNYAEMKKYNRTEHIFTDNNSEENVGFDTYPRGGQSDTWIKEDVITRTGKETLTATIFEGKIINKSINSIQDWYVRLNINKNCYVNNGWCGVVEIHQNVKNGEKVQTLDLREMKREEVELDYIIWDQEVLISLFEGDYIVYYPREVFERPIIGKNSSLIIGLIMYYDKKDFSLDDFEFHYYLKRGIFQNSDFMIFVSMVALWGLVLIGFISNEIAVWNARKQILQKDRLIEESFCVFSNFVDAKDSYTNGHSDRVAVYSKKIAQKLGFSENMCNDIYHIALLHDCGKCYIPDSVLKKRGKLTDDEYQTIKKHTEFGAKILENFNSFPDVYCGALYHHERYDGTGYPTGKKGEDIPLIGRIICVADSFDAMYSKRCYREPMKMEDIINEIERCKGTQFDPKIADVFLEILKDEMKDIKK